jgi:hypothetical protein
MNKMLGGYFAGYSKFGGADAAKELLYDYMSNKIDGGGKKKIKKRVKKQVDTDTPADNNEGRLINERFAIGTINRSELRKSVPRE